MQSGVERDGIDLGGLDGEDVGDLMAWLTLVLEDVLRDVEQGDGAQRDAELLDELAAQSGFRGFAELDAAPDPAVECLVLRGVPTVYERCLVAETGELLR